MSALELIGLLVAVALLAYLLVRAAARRSGSDAMTVAGWIEIVALRR